MKARAYWLFELVAWPAAIWGAVEVSLRAATHTFEGFAMAAATGSLAALTIAACRLRTAQLASPGGE